VLLIHSEERRSPRIALSTGGKSRLRPTRFEACGPIFMGVAIDIQGGNEK
jgi:hypothetical protein